MSSNKLFVFGLGYSASRAARAFHSLGYSVSGYRSTFVLWQKLDVDGVLAKTINKVWEASPKSGSLAVRVGGCLVDQENANDTRVAQILLERIHQVVDFETVNEDVTVLVVDHGTPSRDVHESREFVAKELRGLLKTYQHVKVETACMERREGAEYDFNDPLLALALDRYNVKKGS
ncbi:Gamma-aminobutyric acid type B receptor subunit 2 [Phytophthora nicotianae]|uniref:Gamma-aminobutyric acid type B receptor subunit 2 n=1 Tax=Phytophthora nicotianae TaxID=4792 RepID=A0A0W8DR06_PHYNI|nr:Gamma-aminobutyric acid type B receptor subunit 2 [Phytophthora nicotianae]